MNSSIQVFDSVQEVFGEVYQEVFALLFFSCAFVFFKYNSLRVVPKVQKHVSYVGCNAATANNASPATSNSKTTNAGGGNSPPVGQKRIQDAEEKIMTLLQNREFTAALNAYRTFEREGLDRLFVNEAMYAAFIESAVRVGKLDVVDRMLHTMIRNSINLSLNSWHSILKMLSSRKHYSACIEVFVTYGHILPNDKVIFSCLINAALEGGAHEHALSMLSRYRECDLDVSDYVTAFRAFVATGSAKLAEKLYMEIGANSSPLMLNLVLLAWINDKQPEHAMNLLSKAHEFEASADHAEPGTSAKLVDTISYNTVIKGFVASGDMESCFQCLQSMMSHNLEPDDVTLTSLLEISLADLSGGMTDRLIQMLVQSGQERPLDAATANLFIKLLIRAERLPKAVQVYEALRSSRGSPTIVTYSMLVKALVDSLDMERALLIVQDMVSAGVAPDEIVFTHLLEGARLVGNHKLGETLFKDMLQSGVRPSEYTLTMMVKLHGRYGAHETALKLVETWEGKHGMKPSVIHYTCLMSGCLRNKAYEHAWAAYKLMEKHAVCPDEVVMSTLLPAMVACKAFDRVLHLAHRALRQPGGVRVSKATLNSALSQMLLNPAAAEQASEMRLLMQTARIDVVTTSRGAPGKAEQASSRVAPGRVEQSCSRGAPGKVEPGPWKKRA